MVEATMPDDLDIMVRTDDPTETGDIALVSSDTVLDDCDSVSGWAVESGAGVTVSLNTVNQYEGDGCVKMYIPAFIDGIVTCTIAATDLSNTNYLRVWLKDSSYNSKLYLYFGEAAYDEQSTAQFANNTGAWKEKVWDISAIAAASRNAVTLIGVRCDNSLEGSSVDLYIDLVHANSGDAKLSFHSGRQTEDIWPVTRATIDPTLISVFYDDFLSTIIDADYGTLLHANEHWDIQDSSVTLSSIRSGIVRITGDATTAGYIRPSGTDTTLPYVSTKNPIIKVRCGQYGAGAATRRIGLGSGNMTADPANGIFFRFTAAGNYTAVCRNGGVESTLDTGIAAANGQYNDLQLSVSGTNFVEAFVDGVSKGLITSNIPGSATYLYFSAGTSAVNNDRGIDVDYVLIRQDR